MRRADPTWSVCEQFVIAKTVERGRATFRKAASFVTVLLKRSVERRQMTQHDDGDALRSLARPANAILRLPSDSLKSMGRGIFRKRSRNDERRGGGQGLGFGGAERMQRSQGLCVVGLADRATILDRVERAPLGDDLRRFRTVAVVI